MTRKANLIHMTLVLAFAGAGLMGFAGCASTQKVYEGGLELEQQGRYAEAAHEYVRVLKREPAREDLRVRLRDVGQRALERLHTQAEAAAAVARYEPAVVALVQLDALREEVAEVGVMLTVPEGYLAYRAEMIGRAYEQLVDEAAAAAEAGDYEAAHGRYLHLQAVLPLDRNQQAAITDARARVLVDWGHAEHQSGHFRAAYDRALDALALYGDRPPRDHPAYVLQTAAVEDGTRHVAFLPFARHPEWRREAPRDLDLNDELAYAHWGNPPLFIATINPFEVNREVYTLRADADNLNTRQITRIGRSLDADLVVYGDLRRIDRQKGRAKTKTHKARTRGRSGRDTTYTVETYRLTLVGHGAVRIYDPASERRLRTSDLQTSVSREVERATYAGNYKELNLSADEERLFDPDALEEIEEELRQELARDLAALLAERAFEELYRFIE